MIPHRKCVPVQVPHAHARACMCTSFMITHSLTPPVRVRRAEKRKNIALRDQVEVFPQHC
jgi:hypothetical protein